MKRFFYTLVFSFFTYMAHSQLFIDTTVTPEQMVMDFFDNSCVTPSNITFNGSDISVAYFEGANTGLGINAGIVISSGNVTQIPQPSSTFISTNTGAAGDPDLEGLTIAPSFDAAVLEFDISINQGGDLNFEYIFGSEEYDEWVGSTFNDVFGFFITDPMVGTPHNIAMIPGTSDPVSINNVNSGLNSAYYNPYGMNNGMDVAFDGLTTNLPATFNAVGAETYHVKIGVTDIGDGIFDSGVFIGIESLCGDSLLAPPADALAAVDGNVVTFTNQSRYATSWHWDFGDNTTSDDRHPAPHEYAQAGTYTVTLTTQNWCCEDTYSFTVEVGTVGTDEALEKPFSIFPNPATDFIQINPQEDKYLTYELTDISGKTILSGNTEEDKTLNINHLINGLYLLKIQNHGAIFVEKIKVQR